MEKLRNYKMNLVNRIAFERGCKDQSSVQELSSFDCTATNWLKFALRL